jgi:photosystem II stability/assembly factor-like uncharacterized protein
MVMRTAIGAVAFFACACVLAQSGKPETLEGSNGFVLIRIVTNAAVPQPLMGYHTKWRDLVVQSADGTEVKLSPAPDAGRRSTQVFAQPLAEGRYKPVALRSNAAGIPLAPNDLEFEVKRGRVTNLGTLIVQPTGNSEYTVVPFPGAEDMREYLARELPALAAVAGADTLGWSGGKVADGTASGPRWLVVSNTAAGGIVGTITMNIIQAKIDADARTASVAAWKEATDGATRLRLAKQYSYSLNGLQRLPDGRIAAGSNLGQVLLRDPAAGWQRIDLEDPREITALYAPDGNRMIAGGEEGLLVSTQDGGKTWTRHKPAVAGGLIVHIAEREGQVFVLSVVDDDFWLHSTSDLGSGQWRELRHEKMDFLGLRIYPHMQGMGVLHEGRYYMVVPGQSIHILDIGTGTWTAVKPDSPLRFMGAVKDGFAYATGAINRVAPYLSRDGGATWKKLENNCSATFSGVLSVAFLSPSDAYLLCYQVGMWSNTYTIKRTGDGGATWKDVLADIPGRPFQMYATPEVLLYSDVTGQIHASRDGGASWALESRPQ